MATSINVELQWYNKNHFPFTAETRITQKMYVPTWIAMAVVLSHACVLSECDPVPVKRAMTVNCIDTFASCKWQREKRSCSEYWWLCSGWSWHWLSYEVSTPVHGKSPYVTGRLWTNRVRVRMYSTSPWCVGQHLLQQEYCRKCISYTHARSAIWVQCVFALAWLLQPM
jgi:hypothetical protein